jgi:2,4-dienoyl-CoA reductase-like NADH-dependent reductase (Old Yellow Enzyme family)
MAHLFDPFKLRSVSFRNRIGVSPMCQYFCENGCMSEWHLVHLGSRAVGGAALVMTEATAVEARGRISAGDSGIWSDEQIEPAGRVARFIKKYGAVAGMQLAHAGRKASTARPWEGTSRKRILPAQGGWEAMGPSAVGFYADDPPPRVMTARDIATVQDAFVAGAKRAMAAGFALIELHAAHGYLCHSFHSPISNQRTDEYGGSFENRTRFTIEVVRKLRGVIPQDMPLNVRLSCSDWYPGGWTIEESVELAKKLKSEGVDLIDCSSGAGTPDAKIPVGPGFQVPFADAIRNGAGIATAAVGMITEAKQADEIIGKGQADMVFIARAELNDPYWPLHAAQALGRREAVKLPPPYEYVVK